MKILMLPETSDLGIGRVVDAYRKHLPKHGVQFVRSEQEADLVVCHAGQHAPTRQTDVLICHGLYPTYALDRADVYFNTNADVIRNAREALSVTVPSNWVALPFKRDMAISPYILPHGLDVDDWPYDNDNDGYVLWGKGHNPGVCNSEVVNKLAQLLPDVKFVTTYGDKAHNVTVVGTQPFDKMKRLVAKAGVYLATTKETFGIQTLEAMACGVPIVGYKHGATPDIVQHGSTGWMVKPDDVEGLAAGVRWALKNRRQISPIARTTVERYFTWEHASETLYSILKLTNIRSKAAASTPLVSVIIPCYNYGKWLPTAIESVLKQTYTGPVEIIVVDDGSIDNTEQAVKPYLGKVKYFKKTNGGVAEARNYGIRNSGGELIACLDADDSWNPNFLTQLVPPMLKDRSLGLVYGHLEAVNEHKNSHVSDWPPTFDFHQQSTRHNCVPSSCLFRRSAWERAGGYRAKYTPAEDAELWLRIAATGHIVRKITNDPVYMYRLHSGSLSRTVEEPNWVDDKPYHHDPELTPFAAPANGNKASHPFKDYDDPWVSVIIPVGPGHENLVYRALDSIQTQTLTNWEVIVVNDSGGLLTHPPTGRTLAEAYPYIIELNSKRAGVAKARNIGAAHASTSLLLFLDADDWLLPAGLANLVQTYNENPCNYIYSDWQGFDGKKYSGHTSKEFSVQGITKEALHPITALVPKAWHQEIGGFDEGIAGWEDWVYYLELVKAGHCGFRLAMQCMVYDYSSGTRREDSLSMRNDLLPIIRKRFKEADMACSSCGRKGGSGSSSRTVPVPLNQALARGVPVMATRSASINMSQPQQQDNVKMVTVRENSGNVGSHGVVGSRTRINYGRHRHGDVFQMHVEDASAQPQRYVRVAPEQAASVKPERPVEAPAPAPEPAPDVVAQPPAAVENLQLVQEALEAASTPVSDDEVEVDITILPLAAIKRLDLTKEDAKAALELENSATKPRASVVKYLEQVASGLGND